MVEEQKNQGQKPAAKPAGDKAKPQGQKKDSGNDRGKRSDSPSNRRGGRPRVNRPEREPREFDQQILDIARVTRVTKGGKRMRFRIAMIIGDHKGKVGYGIAKGIDIQTSIQKAVTQAKRNVIAVALQNETIPHAIRSKFAGAQVILKPAPKGTGVKAGGAVRVVMEFAGIPNVTAKILGSKSKINNTKATFQALKRLMPPLKKKDEKVVVDKSKKEKTTETAENAVKA